MGLQPLSLKETIAIKCLMASFKADYSYHKLYGKFPTDSERNSKEWIAEFEDQLDHILLEKLH